MDLLSELEAMALTVESAHEDEIAPGDLERWGNVFGFSIEEAMDRIQEHRNDFARQRITPELWEMIGSDLHSQGHDRESYEYFLYIQRKMQGTNRRASNHVAFASTNHSQSEYLLKLEGPLDSAAKVRNAAGLDRDPVIRPATDDDDECASFAVIDEAGKQNIVQKFSGGFKPTIISISRAEKDLCADSMGPKLEFDSTLPHHRLTGASALPQPQQHTYPVWYFFYGTLTEQDRLVRLLGLAEEPELCDAYVLGGRIKMWAGRYKGLVSDFSTPDARVDGRAFLVESAEQEDALGYYETRKYEVVRCDIHVESGVIQGLTFRFTEDERCAMDEAPD